VTHNGPRHHCTNRWKAIAKSLIDEGKPKKEIGEQLHAPRKSSGCPTSQRKNSAVDVGNDKPTQGQNADRPLGYLHIGNPSNANHDRWTGCNRMEKGEKGGL
jgi:hypothetical protein